MTRHDLAYIAASASVIVIALWFGTAALVIIFGGHHG